jgi:long-chain acyl-CoA synthetase
MTNQSKWHVAACAVLWTGGELVPLDPKLTPEEHAALLAHSRADALVTEWHLWRDRVFAGHAVVTEAPPGADLRGATRWEDARGEGEPRFVERGRDDVACVVYSSGTGGRPKGCRMTHGNYLSQCAALLRHHAFEPGDTYLSILPTNHAIDFMVGFLGPYVCGATVVHLRTLRPEFVRDAFPRYRIAYCALVPMILGNLAEGIRARMAAVTGSRAVVLKALRALTALLCRKRPRPAVGRLLLGPVHRGFGGRLKVLFVGGAFTDPDTLRFFRDLGIPVANGYGLTEAGTVVTLNVFEDYRPGTVGRPLEGTEVRILDPGPDGVGEVAVRGPTVMKGYLDDPELTAETIVDGWLRTGDLGVLLSSGHLVLKGRKKNMIVTAGGKNVYPEDVENVFEGLPAREYCVFAEHTLWPGSPERLVVAVRPDGREFREELRRRNRLLPDYKRVSGFMVVEKDFPRTASLKIRRDDLAALVREAGRERLEAL